MAAYILQSGFDNQNHTTMNMKVSELKELVVEALRGELDFNIFSLATDKAEEAMIYGLASELGRESGRTLAPNGVSVLAETEELPF